MPDREKTIKELDRIVSILFDSLTLLKEQQDEIVMMKTIYGNDSTIVGELVRCKDCDNKECWGRAGDVVCGIDGTPHRPDWFCADGVKNEG